MCISRSEVLEVQDIFIVHFICFSEVFPCVICKSLQISLLKCIGF